MFNYYRMNLKGSGGGQHNTFALTMWIGVAGTFLGFTAMGITGSNFRSSSPIASVIVVSVFYLYFLKFLAEKFIAPRFMLLISSLILLGFSFLFTLQFLIPLFPKGLILGASCITYYAVIFYLTRQGIRRKYFKL